MAAGLALQVVRPNWCEWECELTRTSMEAMHVYHLTIQENGHSRRFVYEDRDEALTRFAEAIAAGLDAKLDEVVRVPALPKPTEVRGRLALRGRGA
ncbi:MAG: hypothetical protein WD965_03420 [Actinomycetota bacterium]